MISITFESAFIERVCINSRLLYQLLIQYFKKESLQGREGWGVGGGWNDSPMYGGELSKVEMKRSNGELP